MTEALPHVGGLRLVDHHCHGVVRRDLDRPAFEALLTESPSAPPRVGTPFDSNIGFALRRWCPPVLDLPEHVDVDAYLARRSELGVDEVTRRFLAATGTAVFCVDTGFEPEPLLTPSQLAAAAGGTGREVVRLETVAETVAEQGTSAASFAADVTGALDRRVRQADAVAVKTIAAYRSGLALPGRRPRDSEVASAVRRWLVGARAGRPPRLGDPVLSAFLVWAGIDLGLPVQVHTGLGDTDANLLDADPLLLTDLLRATEQTGVPIVLLHGYPFHRHAAYLAQVFGHVFCDVGLTVHNVGRRSGAVLEEMLELAPFGKVLFSTDAFGLPELYHLGALLFRRAVSGVLVRGVADGDWSAADADRIAAMLGSDNARRVYEAIG